MNEIMIVFVCTNFVGNGLDRSEKAIGTAILCICNATDGTVKTIPYKRICEHCAQRFG